MRVDAIATNSTSGTPNNPPQNSDGFVQKLSAEVPDLNLVQKGMRGFLKSYSADIVGEVVTKKLTDKALPTSNRITAQSHPSHIDAFPSVIDGGQTIAYNFPAYHPFGVAIRSVGCLRTGNGLVGTVDTASNYLNEGNNRKLWIAPMGKIHSESMVSLAQTQDKVPSGTAAIALKTGVPIVVEAMDPVAAKKNDKRLVNIAAIAGGIGTLIGGTIALLVGKKGEGLSGVAKGLGAAVIAVPASIIGSVLVGLKLAPAPKKVTRVISDVIYPTHIENLDPKNPAHNKAKAELQEQIHKACDRATAQATSLGTQSL